MKTLIHRTVNFKEKIAIILIIMVMSINFQACEELDIFNDQLTELTEEDVAVGLKEALKVGTNHSVELTNREDGFFGNPVIKILWPEEAQGAYNYIDENVSSLKPLLDEVVLKMNRGAEQASEKAKPIFIDAITSITINDAWNILNGVDNEATMYLHDRTYSSLHDEFKPSINNSLQNVGAAQTWEQITTNYNKLVALLPNREPINTDLADYTTTKALDGLFHLVAEEEMKIRTDPKARINDILERVFGELD